MYKSPMRSRTIRPRTELLRRLAAAICSGVMSEQGQGPRQLPPWWRGQPRETATRSRGPSSTPRINASTHHIKIAAINVIDHATLLHASRVSVLPCPGGDERDGGHVPRCTGSRVPCQTLASILPAVASQEMSACGAVPLRAAAAQRGTLMLPEESRRTRTRADSKGTTAMAPHSIKTGSIQPGRRVRVAPNLDKQGKRPASRSKAAMSPNSIRFSLGTMMDVGVAG